jgi:hypothetical protein
VSFWKEGETVAETEPVSRFINSKSILNRVENSRALSPSARSTVMIELSLLARSVTPWTILVHAAFNPSFRNPASGDLCPGVGGFSLKGRSVVAIAPAAWFILTSSELTSVY